MKKTKFLTGTGKKVRILQDPKPQLMVIVLEFFTSSIQIPFLIKIIGFIMVKRTDSNGGSFNFCHLSSMRAVARGIDCFMRFVMNHGFAADENMYKNQMWKTMGVGRIFFRLSLGAFASRPSHGLVQYIE